jgi:fatty acid desaturase
VRDVELVLNNNYHAVHHDLPHVPWFALRNVYETSRQQYVERSGGFLVSGYSEWVRRYAFASVAHPVYGDLSGSVLSNPRASGILRVNRG